MQTSEIKDSIEAVFDSCAVNSSEHAGELVELLNVLTCDAVLSAIHFEFAIRELKQSTAGTLELLKTIAGKNANCAFCGKSIWKDIDGWRHDSSGSLPICNHVPEPDCLMMG
jgi:hypothetical protein